MNRRMAERVETYTRWSVELLLEASDIERSLELEDNWDCEIVERAYRQVRELREESERWRLRAHECLSLVFAS